MKERGPFRTPSRNPDVTDESVFAAALAFDDLAAHAASNPLDCPPANLALTGAYVAA